jgi:hypothetical protein
MEASSIACERYGHIFPLSLESCFDELAFYTVFLSIKCLSEYITDIVRCLTDSSTFLWTEILESLQDKSEFTIFSKYRVLVLYQCLFCLESRKVFEGLGLELLEFL